MKKWLAVHYRDFGDPLDTDACKYQGCWREFHNENDANAWLGVRLKKSETSPKGKFVIAVDTSFFRHGYTECLPAWMSECWYKPDNLKNALLAYLKYKCLEKCI